MRDAKDLKFFICHANPAEHQAIAAQRFDGVDPHTAHEFFDFMPPSVHQVDKTPTARIGIKAVYKFGTLGCDSPVTFTALASAAEMTAESEQGCRCNIAGISTQSDRFYHIRSTADRSAYNKGNIVPDAFLTKPAVHSR